MLNLLIRRKLKNKIKENIKAEITAITPIEARRIVKDSGIMLLPRCTIIASIAYDAIRRDPQD